jgi:hypothetical protein
LTILCLKRLFEPEEPQIGEKYLKESGFQMGVLDDKVKFKTKMVNRVKKWR